MKKWFFSRDALNTISSNIEQIRTWNELQRVDLLVIKLKHPIFGFERSNIAHRSDSNIIFSNNELKRVYLIELVQPIFGFE